MSSILLYMSFILTGNSWMKRWTCLSITHSLYTILSPPSSVPLPSPSSSSSFPTAAKFPLQTGRAESLEWWLVCWLCFVIICGNHPSLGQVPTCWSSLCSEIQCPMLCIFHLTEWARTSRTSQMSADTSECQRRPEWLGIWHSMWSLGWLALGST